MQQAEGLPACEHELIIVHFENAVNPRKFRPECVQLDAPPHVDYYGRIGWETRHAHNSCILTRIVGGSSERMAFDDGWLLSQSEVRLRLQSTTFWKSRYKNRPLFVKVTPVDLRYREVRPASSLKEGT